MTLRLANRATNKFRKNQSNLQQVRVSFYAEMHVEGLRNFSLEITVHCGGKSTIGWILKSAMGIQCVISRHSGHFESISGLVSFYTLVENISPPIKFFLIGDNLRNQWIREDQDELCLLQSPSFMLLFTIESTADRLDGGIACEEVLIDADTHHATLLQYNFF